MRRALCLFALLALAAAPLARADGPAKEEERREIIYVPRDEMDALIARHGRGVVLPVAKYLELWRAAKEGRVTPVPPPDAEAVVLGARIEGVVGDETAELAATIDVRVLADGLVRVPFPLSGAGVRSVAADGKTPLLSADGGGAYLLLAGKGDHDVRLRLVSKVGRNEEVRSLSLALPLGATAAVDLAIPDGTEPVEGTLGGTWRTEERADGTHVLARLAPADGLAFSFRPARATARREAFTAVEGQVLHTVGSRLLTTVAFLDVSFLRRPVAEIVVTAPADAVVTEVAAPDLEDWGPDGEGRYRLVLRHPARGVVPVVVKAERALPGPGEVDLPEIRVAGADDTRGVVGIRYATGVDGRSVSADGYARVAAPRPAKGAPSPVLAGAAAAWRYWSADRKIVVRTETPEAVVDCEETVALALSSAGREVSADFLYSPRGEPVFALAPALPDLYVLADVVVTAPVPHRWEEGDGGRLLVTFPAGSPPGKPIRITFRARLDTDAWRDESWQETTFPLPALASGASGRTDGRLAVLAPPEFELGDAALEGLHPEPVDRLGLPAARLGYRWSGDDATGRLVVTRRPARVGVRHVAVVAPGEKVARYTGFLHYTIRRAGVRRFAFTVSGGHGDRLNVVAPDGAEPVRRVGPDGTDLWEIVLPERVLGDVLVSFSLEEEMAEADGGRTFTFPVVRALDVDGEETWLAVETGDNLEVDVTSEDGLRRIDPSEMVFPGVFRPSRGLLAAWQAAGRDYDLAVRAVRHEDHPVLAAFVSTAEILSVVAEDGTVRSRGTWALLNAGRQFLTVRLPVGSVLWAAHVGGAPVKPAKGADGWLVPLRTTGAADATEVRLVWETAGEPLGSSGALYLAAPELVGVPGATADWQVWLPSRYRVTETSGVFAAARREPPPPWLVRVFDALVRSGRGPAVGGETSAPAASVTSYLRDEVAPAADAVEAEEKPAPAERAKDEEGPPVPKPQAPMPPPDAPGAAPPEGAAGPGTPPPGDRGAEEHGGPATGETPPPSKAAAPAPPARLGKAGALPIDVELVPGGTPVTASALGVRGSLRVEYADEPARDTAGWVATVLVVLLGVLATGQLRRGGPRAGARIAPGVFVVFTLALATFAPAWFGVRDPSVWDGIARGAVLTILALLLIRLVRFVATHGRAAATAAALLVLLGAASVARAEGEKVYVPYDPGNLGDLDAEGKVFLPFERFRELWNAAHPDRVIEKPEEAPVPWLLVGAGYDGRTEGDFAVLDAAYDLVVLADGWVEVALPLAPAVVESARVDGEPVRVMAKEGRQVLLLSGKGAHEVSLSLRIGLGGSADERVLEMAVPPIPHSRFTFTLPGTGYRADLAGPAPAVVDGADVTAWLGPVSTLRLSFGPRTEVPRVEARVEAETREALAEREGRAELRLRTVFRVVTGGVRALSFRVAGPFALVDVRGPDVKSHSLDGESLSIDLGREVTDETTVELLLLAPDGARTRTTEVPDVRPLGVVRERGLLAVASVPDLRPTVEARANLERIAAKPEDFPGLLPAGAALHSAWRFVMRPLGMTVRTEPVQSEVRARVDVTHFVARDRIESVAKLSLEVRGDGAFAFPIRLPAAYEPTRVTGGGLERWWRDGDTLTLATANPVRGTFDAEIRFRRRLEPDAVRVELPEIHALDVDRETGSILVGRSPELSLTLLAEEGLVKEDVAAFARAPKLDPRQVNSYAWREEGGAYSLAVARSFPEARVRPVTTTRLQVLDESVVIDTHVAFEIENAGEDTFRVFFPAGEGEDPIVVAENSRRVAWSDAERDGRAGRLLTVVLQQPATSRYDLRVVTERKLVREAGKLREGAISVAAPVPEGTNPSSWVMVENQSSGEVLFGARAGLEKAAPSEFPYLPAGLDPRLLVGTFRGRGAVWELDVSLVIHDFASFPDALVSTAEITVAVGRDGWTRNRATWRVLNRKLQFLELSLPDRSTLEAVDVGGEAVKPGQRTVGGETRILVPLARMQPGDVSTTVTVYWSRPLPHAGRSLDDLGELDIREPKLHGFEVEQTFFTVALPEGFAYSFDGNMHPVLDTAIEVWSATKRIEELERLADVQVKGSAGQRLQAEENFVRQRELVRDQLARAASERRERVGFLSNRANLAALDEAEREELRKQLADEAETVAKLQRQLDVLSSSFEEQAAARLNLGEAEKGDEQRLVAEAQELAQNRREQEYRYKGKQNVAQQDWSRNTAGAPAAEPATGQTADRWAETRARLEAGDYESAVPFDGPSTNAAIGVGGGAGGRFAGRGARPANAGGAGGGEGAPFHFGAGYESGGGGGGGARVPGRDGDDGYYDSGAYAAGATRAGLLSLSVTVPERGEVYRFEKRNGGAKLVVSVSEPGAGRGFAGFAFFAVAMALLVLFYRFRPDRRYRGWNASLLIAAGILLGILTAFGPFILLALALIAAGGTWLARSLRHDI